MGFIQKLAKRNPRVYEKGYMQNKTRLCDCEGNPKIPKLTLKYILNPKNWR
tara:strand:+ start:56 stop:208 length:153 start_codon:yes stop_codon:yes gene_type:complete